MNEEIKVYLEKYSEGNYQNFSSNFAGTDWKWDMAAAEKEKSKFRNFFYKQSKLSNWNN